MSEEIRKPPAGDVPSDLLQELASVVDLVQQATRAAGKTEYAVIRPVHGLEPEAWAQLASAQALELWITVPLRPPQAEALRTILAEKERLAFQRDHDALTGLSNRGMFDRTLASEVDRAIRSHTDLSLVMIDLDHFKKVNDTYGHDCGDRVLARLGQVLKTSVRSYDTAARVGGEEFAVVLPATPSWTALILAKRILDTFRKEFFDGNGSHFNLSFSAGVSSVNLLEGKPTPSLLMKTADQALYAAKNKGRNQVLPAESKKSTTAVGLVHSQEKLFLFECKGME